MAGQPQVVSRVMTLKDDAARKQALVWFFVWQTPFIILMFIIGLACRVLLPELGTDGAQTGLPMLAMEQLNPFLGGVILASIFAATMSTADSQVLACTAAITDDVQPDWSQDHKTTKMVTLAMAALATVISLVGQQFPGFGDSVFALVVLAVYGLGGIFVPMILVRMSGYEPDTTHSIMMMIAAMSGVLVWTVLGYGDAEGIFPSVPGVGAAFATHFLLCWLRDESPSNAFGRYAVPTQKPAAIGLAILLAVVAVTEVSYQVFAPDSANNANKVAAYEVRGDVSFHEIVSGSEYVEDGASIDVGAFVDEEGEFSELNIVGVRLTIGHGPDDETQQGVGCALADGPQDDTVDYSYAHNEENFSNVADAALLDVYVEWYNASIVNNIVDGLSMLEIEEMLDGDGNGFGQHDMTLGVEVETGGGLGCQSNDDGEEVRYSIQLISLEYEITRV